MKTIRVSALAFAAMIAFLNGIPANAESDVCVLAKPIDLGTEPPADGKIQIGRTTFNHVPTSAAGMGWDLNEFKKGNVKLLITRVKDEGQPAGLGVSLYSKKAEDAHVMPYIGMYGDYRDGFVFSTATGDQGPDYYQSLVILDHVSYIPETSQVITRDRFLVGATVFIKEEHCKGNRCEDTGNIERVCLTSGKLESFTASPELIRH